MITLDLTTRARGALLGHAAGNALGVPTEFLGTPEAIRERFSSEVRDVIRQDSEQSPYDDDVALTIILAEELLEPDVDLHRLAMNWAEWADKVTGSLGTVPSGQTGAPLTFGARLTKTF